MDNGFTELFRDELPHLWRFGFRLSRNQDVAEELVQRTVLRAFEKRHQFQEGSQLRQWLFAILHSIWKNDLRAASIRESHAFSVKATSSLVQDCTAESSQLLAEVAERIDLLPDAQREVLLLIGVEGYSYKEAAEILEVPTGTVMSRLARARLTIGEYFLMDSPSKKLKVEANEN